MIKSYCVIIIVSPGPKSWIFGFFTHDQDLGARTRIIGTWDKDLEFGFARFLKTY